MATASELFKARHYPGVVALVSDALESEPESVPLLLVRARAHIALRRDLDAQADLRDIIRLDPQCSLAYRLLGELAARRDENESAAIFFREALRLDPGDREAQDWLAIAERPARPAAVANKLPAPATAAGRFPSARVPVPRFAQGTRPPDDERPTARRWGAGYPEREPEPLPPPPPRMATGSSPTLPPYQEAPSPAEVATYIADAGPPELPAEVVRQTIPGAQPVRRPLAQRGPLPELPGFGDYLVSTGILTRERLRAAQAYQRSMKVHLATAIVTLGLATPQRIEWAAVAHQAQLARGG